MLKRTAALLLFLLLLCPAALAGCAAEEKPASSAPAAAESAPALPLRDCTPKVLVPAADGVVVFENDRAAVDASHTGEGYVMVEYRGSNPKVKLQITTPQSVTYTYTLHDGWECFPLTGGSGQYRCNVFEQIAGSEYSYALSYEFEAVIPDDTLPYLYPNQYVNFTADCETVAVGAQLAQTAHQDLDVVAAVYDYIVGSYTYDFDKAATVQSGYLPVVDEILKSRTGICFDYTAVMASMLRSQGIPTRMDVGWAGDIYHAWVSVYTPETGWVDGIIRFDGENWQRMDPTFAEGDDASDDIMDFISDDTNYILKYTY